MIVFLILVFINWYFVAPIYTLGSLRVKEKLFNFDVTPFRRLRLMLKRRRLSPNWIMGRNQILQRHILFLPLIFRRRRQYLDKQQEGYTIIELRSE
ncbi:unnamed protein product [Arabidopsis halleri]